MTDDLNIYMDHTLSSLNTLGTGIKLFLPKKLKKHTNKDILNFVLNAQFVVNNILIVLFCSVLFNT